MRAVETFSVLAFIALLILSLGRISGASWLVALALGGGWLLADLFSGLAHWALDRFGSVRTPVVGPAIIRPFREHHADPQGMTRHDFIEVNGASCLGCLPLLALSLALDGFAHALDAFTCLGVLLTNQCHKWAHLPADAVPVPVRVLQRLGLVLRPDEHAKHHTAPYDSHFCTANGWLNRPLNALLR